MTDTPETLQAALKELEARVAAFEKARAEEEEPPKLTEESLNCTFKTPDEVRQWIIKEAEQVKS